MAHGKEGNKVRFDQAFPCIVTAIMGRKQQLAEKGKVGCHLNNSLKCTVKLNLLIYASLFRIFLQHVHLIHKVGVIIVISSVTFSALIDL